MASSSSSESQKVSHMEIASRPRAPMDVSGEQFSIFRVSANPQIAEDGLKHLPLGSGSMNSDSEGADASSTREAISKIQTQSSTAGGLVGRRKKLLEAGRREVDSAASATSREQNDAILRHEISGDSLLRIMTEKQANMNNKILTYSESGDKEGIEAVIFDVPHFKWDSCRGLNNYTPLHHACSRGHEQVAYYILDVAPTLLHSMTNSDETPLHLAATSGNLLLIERLVDLGADLDAQTKDGETPLMYAARKSLPAMVRCLLGLGAHVQVEDKYGDNALDYCDHNAHTSRWINIQIHQQKSPINGLKVQRGHKADIDSGNDKVDRIITDARHLQGLDRVMSYLEVSDLARAAMVSPAWHRAAAQRELWDALGCKRWKMSLDLEEMNRSGSRGFPTHLAGPVLRPKSK